MSNPALTLEHRSVVRLTGSERTAFLNGLITNDVAKAQHGHPIYAGLLTPQGKFLFDMLIFFTDDALWLDVEKALKTELVQRLTMYKLRADVLIEDMEEAGFQTIAFQNDPSLPLSGPDPRHPNLGYRAIVEGGTTSGGWALDDYERTRIRAGVPDGARDIAREKYFWPETNAEAHNGTDYGKGCYVGQELVSRLKHRSEVKKLILPARIEGGALESGATITNESGQSVGQVLTHMGKDALIYLKLSARDETLTAGGGTVHLSC